MKEIGIITDRICFEQTTLACSVLVQGIWHVEQDARAGRFGPELAFVGYCLPTHSSKTRDNSI